MCSGFLSLSLQFSPNDEDSGEEAILPRTCVVGVTCWEVEDQVWQGQQDHPALEDCPPSRLFVPHSARPCVLQWGHASKIACHLSFHRTPTALLVG